MAGLARLWRAGQLCDVLLRTDIDGHTVAAHSCCLAATSGCVRSQQSLRKAEGSAASERAVLHSRVAALAGTCAPCSWAPGAK